MLYSGSTNNHIIEGDKVMGKMGRLAKISGTLAMLALAGGCAPHMSGGGSGYGGGAPFAPYGTGGYGGATGVGPSPYSSGYGSPSGGSPGGCGGGYPTAGCGGGSGGSGGGLGWKQGLGTLGGGALGGWAGSQIGGGTGKLAATAAGTLLGALIGNGVGSSLDKSDETYAWMEVQRSLSSNQPLVWRGHESAGVVTPMRTLPKKKKSDETCREFHHKVFVGDREQEGVGRACLQRDGSWKLANG